MRITRAWYHCRQCGHGFAPRDQQLGVPGTPLSPGLTEMIARAGAEIPFGKAAELLAGLAGISVSAKTIERCAEASIGAICAAARAFPLTGRKADGLGPGLLRAQRPPHALRMV